MDKEYNLRLGVVPEQSKEACGFLSEYAFYYCGVLNAYVARERKPLVVTVFRDSLLLTKVKGTMARRVLFVSIRSIVSNVKGTPAAFQQNTKSDAKSKKGPELFVVLLLSPQERSDLILTGDGCREFFQAFESVWNAMGLQGRIPVDASLTYARYTELNINIRVPQSSRDGVVSLTDVPKRSAVVNWQPPPPQVASSVAATGGSDTMSNTTERPAAGSFRRARSVMFVGDDGKGELFGSPEFDLLQGDSDALNPLIELPYATFQPQDCGLFPSYSLPDKALFFCEKAWLYQPPLRSGDPSFIECFVLLSITHVYCAIAESNVLRCNGLRRVKRLWSIADLSELTSNAQRGPSVGGLLFQFDNSEAEAALSLVTTAALSSGAISTPAADNDEVDAVSPSPTTSPAKRSLLASPTKSFKGGVQRYEHDLLIAFRNEAQSRAFAKVLQRILDRAHSADNHGNNPLITASTLYRANPKLEPAPQEGGYTPRIVPIPTKIFDPLQTTMSMRSPMRRRSSVAPVAAAASLSPLRRRSSVGTALIGGAGAAGGGLTGWDPSEGDKVGLLATLRQSEGLVTEFPVPSSMTALFPPLAHGSIVWGSLGLYHPYPLKKQAGQRSSEIHALFITRSQFVVAREEATPQRVMPLKSIREIRVKTMSRKEGEHNRQILVFVGSGDEHDLCIEMEREVDGKRLLASLLGQLRRLDAYYQPAVRSFFDIEGEGFRFEPRKLYTPRELDLPDSFETIGYRRQLKYRLTKALQQHDPTRVSKVDIMMEEYKGREAKLMEKMIKHYGAELDEQDVDPFGYYRRLTSYCLHYLPHSVDEVQSALIAYQGQEEAMFQILTKRFGPEPASSVDPKDLQRSQVNEQLRLEDAESLPPRERLVRFYAKYQPDKLIMVDDILTKYEGKESRLFAKLRNLYGPEPTLEEDIPDASILQKKNNGAEPDPHEDDATTATGDSLSELTYAQRLEAMCRRYKPKQMAKLPTILEDFKGNELELLQGMVKKYGPEPIPALPSTRKRLRMFFAKFLPEPMSDDKLDEILTRYPGTESELYESLAKRYGAATTVRSKDGLNESIQLPPSKEVIEAQKQREARQRTVATFDEYDPHSVSVIRDGTGDVISQPSATTTTANQDDLDLYERVDLLTQLPYVDIPSVAHTLFPHFSRACLFYFDRAVHWIPSVAPMLVYLYVSSTHLYVARSETVVHRCIALDRVQELFVNTKRLDPESQCGLLIKLHPKEPDLFLSFESDFEAKKLLWILAELSHRYNQQRGGGRERSGARRLRVNAVESLADDEADPHCDVGDRSTIPPPVPVPMRRSVQEGTGPTDAERASFALFSKLHEALIEKGMDSAATARNLEQEAALEVRAHGSAIVQLSAKDRRTFGTVRPSAMASAAHGNGDLQHWSSPQRGSPMKLSELRASNAKDPLAASSEEEDEDGNKSGSHKKKRQPQQNRLISQQAQRHSQTGTFGTIIPSYASRPNDALWGPAPAAEFAVADLDERTLAAHFAFAAAPQLSKLPPTTVDAIMDAQQSGALGSSEYFPAPTALPLSSNNSATAPPLRTPSALLGSPFPPHRGPAALREPSAGNATASLLRPSQGASPTTAAAPESPLLYMNSAVAPPIAVQREMLKQQWREEAGAEDDIDGDLIRRYPLNNNHSSAADKLLAEYPRDQPMSLQRAQQGAVGVRPRESVPTSKAAIDEQFKRYLLRSV